MIAELLKPIEHLEVGKLYEFRSFSTQVDDEYPYAHVWVYGYPGGEEFDYQTPQDFHSTWELKLHLTDIPEGESSVENNIRFSWDGDMICAIKHDDFINLQESPAGFGKTKAEACANLVLSCVDHFQDWLKGRPNDLDYQRKISVEG